MSTGQTLERLLRALYMGEMGLMLSETQLVCFATQTALVGYFIWLYFLLFSWYLAANLSVLMEQSYSHILLTTYFKYAAAVNCTLESLFIFITYR